MKRKKGQSSVEYTILLAVLFIILVVIISIVFSQYNKFERESDLLMGRMAVEKICNSVDHLSNFDDGSVNHIIIYLPPTYDPAQSYVKGKIINLRIGNSDINCVTSGNVRGTLPDTSGKIKIKIEKKNNEIVIG